MRAFLHHNGRRGGTTLNDSQLPAQQKQRSVRGHILFTIAVLGLLALCWKLSHVLEIVYVSGLFAVILTPVVGHIGNLRIRNWHPSKAVSVIVLLFGLLAALGLFFWIGLPPVLSDFRNFLADLPHRIPSLVGRLAKIPYADKIGLPKIAAEAENSVGAVASYVFTALPKWAEHLLDIVTAVILTVYFILEGSETYDYFISLVPLDRRPRLADTLVRAEQKVSRWLLGQLSLMGIVAVYSLVAFGILHVRYFVLFGILMGITNIIPIAGNLITIVLVTLVAASDSLTKAALVIVVYLIYTQLENAFLTPRIMKSSVDLMGTTVLVALLCGTAIAGIVGALVAVPTAALVVVFTDEYLVQKDGDAQRDARPAHT